MWTELTLTLGTAGWATSVGAVTAAWHYRRRLHTDELTGLGNRTALYRAARRIRRHPGLVGVLMVDLDHFKAINDTHGHDFGNRVLATVAARLTETTDPGELAVRLHGDEFALWLGPLGQPAHAGHRADAVTTALTEPIWVDGIRLTALGSVGVATAPAATPLADLLAQADHRMYAIKSNRRLTVLPTGHTRRTRDQHGGNAA